jgi:hypothetical protein
LKEIITAIDSDENNTRIARNLDLKKEILVLLHDAINPFTLSILDYKIQNINSLANDHSLQPISRAGNAMKKFSRLSESEIVTPEKITDEMVSILPDGAVTNSTILLDIAAKQGEFVYAAYKKHGKAVADNFYSIPTSKIAYEFTRKVYTLLELDVSHIIADYTSYDLLEENNIIENDQIKIGDTYMKFDVIVGNPPYQENISSNSKNASLSKQLFPAFIEAFIKLNSSYLSLITPSRWFTGDAQDKSFLKLREYIKENNHIQKISNYPNSRKIFPDVELGSVNYFLYNPNYTGNVEFTEYSDDENKIITIRPLFEVGLDIILSNGRNYRLIQKIKSDDFVSITTITQGRNAFGIIGKNVNDISTKEKSKGDYEIRCKYEEIRYIKKEYITKNINIADSWKVLISKGNGGAGLLTDNKEVAILGKPYIGKPKSVCTDSLIPIGCFTTEFEAVALSNYIKTKFFRYMIGLLKVSQNVLQNVYQFVPLQDFTSASDIDWNQSVADIDQQLYAKYGLSDEEVAFIEGMIKEM